jgi:exo-beta-1,3-glucanase (GH17 family)
VVLSISQGIYQQDDTALQNREIANAFSAAIDANNLQPGTVWGLTFTNEFVTDGNNGPKVLQMIRDNKARAHELGLKVGPRVHTCGEIWGGNNQNILTLLAQESDFIMCNMYPSQGANPETGVQQMKDAYFSARDGFWQHNDKLEVMIGETGWASEGETFNGLVNTIENERRFWDGMKSFANSENVKIQMFQAIDEPWKTGLEGEKHFGWWYRPNNNEAKYIEKSTGQVYE